VFTMKIQQKIKNDKQNLLPWTTKCVFEVREFQKNLNSHIRTSFRKIRISAASDMWYRRLMDLKKENYNPRWKRDIKRNPEIEKLENIFPLKKSTLCRMFPLRQKMRTKFHPDPLPWKGKEEKFEEFSLTNEGRHICT